MHRTTRDRLTVLLLGGVSLIATSCSVATSDATTGPAPQTAASDTIPFSPGGTVDAITTLATTTTTVPPTTTTTTTEPPTTTEAPTTTAPPKKPKPSTTTSTLPRTIRPIEAVAPLVAVWRSSGGETARIQQRLLDLGFWLSGVDGQYGLTTTQAVMAFQKFAGLESSGSVDQATADTLSSFPVKAFGLSDTGNLVEVDKQRQLLFVIRDGLTLWVFNTSTGNGEEYTEEDKNSPGDLVTGIALTPNGLYRVDRERPEGWWEGDLGQIYRPKYFRGGIAVHGSNSIPNYPASHGCVRVSVPAMDFIWAQDLMPMRSTVWVHEGL